MYRNKNLLEWIKKYIRDSVTYDVEAGIRTLLCPAFREKHMAYGGKNGDRSRGIKDILGKNSKISIVFFCHFPSVWNAVKSVFLEALKEEDMEVYLLALPAKIMKENIDYSHEIYGENQSCEFCRQFYPETINAVQEDGSWFDLRKLNPDYVILSRPYDKEVPLCYRSETLSAYTKICYIPYSYCKMNWDSRLVYGFDFLDHVYAVFTENEMYCKMIRKIFCGMFKAGWKKVNCLGYPRFDLYHNGKRKEKTHGKTVLWLPRWSTRQSLEPSTFFQYKELLTDYFKEHPQYRLICRPHQLMFRNFILTGEMSEEEAAKFKACFAETANFLLDESGDYMDSFSDADIFISDTSSLLIEELITGKPILFCGNRKHFDKEAKKWAKLMYSVRSGKELICRLEELLDGCDPVKDSRERFIKEKLEPDGKCGKRIIDFIKDDHKNCLSEKGLEEI